MQTKSALVIKWFSWLLTAFYWFLTVAPNNLDLTQWITRFGVTCEENVSYALDLGELNQHLIDMWYECSIVGH